MAARLTSDFYSQDGDKYTVIIDDADWGGGTTDFNATELVLNYSGQSKEKFNPIIASDLNLSILIENSTLVTFQDDLIAAEESRFTVKVNKNDSIYWAGIIKTDSVYIEDRPQKYNLKIAAVDGIGRLKDLDYNNNGSEYTGKETFIDHIFNILDKIGLDGFWGASDTYFQHLTDWFETTQTNQAVTCPLDSARFDHKALIFVDKSGEKTYSSCYDVLRQICEAWGARFMLSDGAYRMNQINYYADTGTVIIRKYTKSKGYSTTGNLALSTWDKEVGESTEFAAGTKDLFKVTSGGFSFYPPLQKSEVWYKHFSTVNLIRYEDITNNVTVEDVDSNTSSARIAFQGKLIHSTDFTPTFYPHFLVFHLKIKIGSYYAYRDATVVNGNIVNDPNVLWTTGAASRYVFIVPSYMENEDLIYNIGFVTAPIAEDGDMDVQLSFVRATNDDFTTISQANYTLTWSINDPYLEVLQEGTIEDQSNVTKFHSINDTGGNTAVVKKETIFGDGPTGNAFGHIQVTTDDVNWGVADGWRKADTGSYVDFSQLLANELLYAQQTPVKKMESCQFRGSFEAHHKLIRSSENFLLIGGRHNLAEDVWDGEWFYLSVASSGITQHTPEPFYSIRHGVLSAPIPGFAAPSGGTPGLAYYEAEKQGDIYTTISNGTDIPITTTDTGIVDGDPVVSLDIPTFGGGDLYLEDDVVFLSNPNSGASQNFTAGSGHAEGDTTLTVNSSYANYDYSTGSNIVANPLYQQYDLSFGRRKFFQFDLQRYSVDLPSSATYVIWDNFFRPLGDDSTNDSFQFVDRVFIRQFHWIIAQNVSDSASVDYSVRVLRGGSTTVSSGTFDGTDTYKVTTVESGEELMQSDIYTFQIKRDDISGLDSSKGLKCIMECYNKRFQPDDFTTLDLWLKSDYGITTAGGVVSAWDDAGGENNDASQGTGANQPTHTVNVLNGYSGVSFDETSDYLDTGVTLDPNTNNFSVFVVVNAETINTVTAETILSQADGAGTGRELLKINTSKAITSQLGNVTLTGDTLTDDTNYILSLTWDGTTQSMRVNGATADTNTPTAEAANGAWRLGATKTPGEYFGGYLHEVIIYSEALPDRRRELVESYLSLKFNIAL